MVVENDDYHEENEIFIPIVMIVTTTTIVMNEFDHSILELLKRQRIRPEKGHLCSFQKGYFGNPI